MIVITQYPSVNSGTRSQGELYELVGENLNYLPDNLIATFDTDHLQAERPYNIWPLSHVDEDGTRAWFMQQATYTYSTALDLSILATGLTPPREQFTDYQYDP